MRHATALSVLLLGCAANGTLSAEDPEPMVPIAGPDAGATPPPPSPETCEVQAFEANCNDSLDIATCTCTHYDVQWCGPEAAERINCLDDSDTLAAIDALRELGGIETYVLGYETAEWAELLDRMARRGGTGESYAVGDEDSLRAALSTIGGSVVSCRYDLVEAPDDIRFVRVLVDGGEIDHVSISTTGDGWQLNGDRTIELVGAPCDSLRDGATHDIAIEKECHALF